MPLVSRSLRLSLIAGFHRPGSQFAACQRATAGTFCSQEHMTREITPFETIRRPDPAGREFWSSREFAKVLGYADYRNFQTVIESARTACVNSGQVVVDHFVDVTEMIEIGKGGQRSVKTVMMSRYACYLVIQNPDPRQRPVDRRNGSRTPASPAQQRQPFRPRSGNPAHPVLNRLRQM